MSSWSCLTSNSITSLFVFTKYSVLMCINLMYMAFAWQAVKSLHGKAVKVTSGRVKGLAAEHARVPFNYACSCLLAI